MAATDATPFPIKNQAFRLTGIHFRDADGALITTWAGADSEKSLDGASFSDCTNELTEVGTSGIGYLELTATETNVSYVDLKLTITNTDAIPQVITLYPVEDGDIPVDVTEWNGTAVTGDGDWAEMQTDLDAVLVDTAEMQPKIDALLHHNGLA